MFSLSLDPQSVIDSPPILTYHKVERRPELGITWISPERFERHIRFLQEFGYATIHLREAAALLRGGTVLPPSIIAITFDDGYQGILDSALPVLQQCGFTATVFVVTGYVGRMNTWDVNLGWRAFPHLDWEGLGRLLDADVEVGSHTVSHRDLTTLSCDQASEEIEGSREELRRRLGVQADILSYPFGRYNDAIIALTKRAGYAAACSLRSSRGDDLFSLRQRGVYAIDTLLDLRWKLRRSPFSWLEMIKLRMIAGFSYGTILAQTVREMLKT
ncbi:MAG: polysaccharide deacetylase family protein [Candidatus Latescibacteria bacterium]|nr:polysaccharide deacetylase family protein [Candidatus Latescibacterota bacterium]